MLKPIVEVYPVLPAKDEEERAARRPLGRDAKLYQEVMEGWHEIIVEADRLGFWGAAAIEHHFWSEGYQVGPSPGVLNAYWAAITKRLHVGQLGYVLGTYDPIRLAEETAILSHLTRGRFFVGLARGYQNRWMGTIGQHIGATPTKSPKAAEINAAASGIGFAQAAKSQSDLDQDARNRAMFEEHFDILTKAWTKDSFRHRGLNWQVPYPFDDGIKGWQLADAGITQRLGAPGEVDEEGTLREISVVPAPYGNEAPPIFCSGSGTPETIDFCARNGFVPVYFTNINTATKMAQRYVDVAAQHGRSMRLGQNQCMVRWIHFGDSDEHAVERLLEYDGELWKNFYCPMGKRSIDLKDAAKSAMASGLYAAGTVDTVRKQLLDEFNQVPADYLVLIYHYAQMPKDKVLENMNTFMREVKPAIDELLAKKQAASANPSAGSVEVAAM
jgi:alkanesulfonate monooxygenase SsuD/methylene tetrahydromethanopterin reductase-like flavin-dependent oxidoreductase (luciferase family)